LIKNSQLFGKNVRKPQVEFFWTHTVAYDTSYSFFELSDVSYGLRLHPCVLVSNFKVHIYWFSLHIFLRFFQQQRWFVSV